MQKTKKEIAHSGSRVSKLDVLQSFCSSIRKVLNICKCIFCPKIVSHWVTSPNKSCNISGGGCVVSVGGRVDGSGVKISAHVFVWGLRLFQMCFSLLSSFDPCTSSQRCRSRDSFSLFGRWEKRRSPERSSSKLKVTQRVSGMAGVRTLVSLRPGRGLRCCSTGHAHVHTHRHACECLHHSRTHMNVGQTRSHRCILHVHVSTSTHMHACAHTDALPALAVTNCSQTVDFCVTTGEGRPFTGKETQGFRVPRGENGWCPISPWRRGEGDLLKATRIGWGGKRQRGWGIRCWS